MAIVSYPSSMMVCDYCEVPILDVGRGLPKLYRTKEEAIEDAGRKKWALNIKHNEFYCPICQEKMQNLSLTAEKAENNEN